MRISVIIPTYKRLRMLVQALNSLQKQTLSDFEILVVDNGADAQVDRMVERFNERAKVRVRYVAEPRLGLHHARHAGARDAKADLLVFTDDDATFDPGWLQAYADAFEAHREMVAGGGPVRPVWEVPPPQWLLEFMGDSKMFGILSLMEPYHEFRLDPKGWFFGVNMAIRRDVLFKLGGFNPEAFGDSWLGDGETGLNRSLWERKMLIAYVPGAIAYHHIPPQRMTVEYFCQRMANEGACDVYGRFHHGIPSSFRLLRHAAGIGVRNGKSWVMARLVRGRTDRESLNIQINAARTQSQLKYVFRLMLNKTFRELVVKKDWINQG